MDNKTLMNTIDNTYKRCQEENIGISRHFLRHICVNNIIPTCKIGRKYLINWNILMDYLNGKLSITDEKEIESYEINKIKRVR